jgi:glycine/D-amino acid oxidase-like deaminating enzyme
MVDYLIVGAGIAGICFAETAFLNNRSFIVISDTSQNSSIVAAGIYNPVILKRFSLPADAQLHLEYMKPFYATIQERLNVLFDNELPVYRRFASVEEQNFWFEAADKPALAPFLSTDIVHTKYPFFSSPFGFGKVLHTGYVDTISFLNSYQNELKRNNHLVEESFDYHVLKFTNEYIQYKDVKAQHIIFAEGFGIHVNPYFNYLPLDGTKGELLLIKAPALKLDAVINAGVFILPVGNDHYKVGATYEWYDKTAIPTEAGKKELLEKFEELITCDYEVIEHYAGIRPTVKDRKALIGSHPVHKNVHLLNGLGTRGVMLGPYMAKELYESIENGKVIERSINLTRFKM